MNSTVFIGEVGDRGASVATPQGKSYQIVSFALVDKKKFPSGKTFTEFCMVEWFGKQAVEAMDSLKPGVLCVVAGEVSILKRDGKEPLLKIRATACTVRSAEDTEPRALPINKPERIQVPQQESLPGAETEDDVPF